MCRGCVAVGLAALWRVFQAGAAGYRLAAFAGL